MMELEKSTEEMIISNQNVTQETIKSPTKRSTATGLERSESKKERFRNALISTGKEALKEISLAWHDVNVSVKISPNPIKYLVAKCRKDTESAVTTEKPILRGVSGSVKSGQLLAIIGSSGAGKTTFLNYLTHKSMSRRTFQVTGQVSINGERISCSELAQRSAYVQQEDIFIGTLTVREHLNFYALLRIGSQVPYKAKFERVKQVIEMMGLDKCKDSTIGVPGYTKGISGGEKKRLSFATELLNNPTLLLADEPTSGLDSYLASTVVECLLTLAENGRTVLCTIHQPSSEIFSLFTNVMVLAEGRVAYMGEREGMTPHLSKINLFCPTNYNPSDYVINILSVVPGKEDTCKKRIETICDHFSLHYQAPQLEEGNGEERKSKKVLQSIHFTAPFWLQLMAVFWREVKSSFRNKPLIIFRFLQQLIQGILMGLIYFQIPNGYSRIQNVSGLIFLSVISQSMGNIFGVLNSFPAQLPVFWKEHFSGMYRVWAYFISKTFAELPFFLFFPFVFAIVVYFMVGLSVEVGRFFFFYFVLTLAGNAALSLGYFASAVSPSVSIGLAIGPVLMFPFIIFGGLFAQSGSLGPWLSWIEYISWFKYSFEALIVNEWTGFKFSNQTIAACLNTTSAVGCFRTGEDVIRFYNLEAGNLWLDIGVMAALIVVWRILAFFALLIQTTIRGYF